MAHAARLAHVVTWLLYVVGVLAYFLLVSWGISLAVGVRGREATGR